MKIEYQEKKIIVYLYRYQLDIHNLVKLNQEIKNLFVKLIKRYHLEVFGYNKVHVYENKKYGCILEIEQIYHSDFSIDIIDLKLIIHEDVPFYIEMDDNYFNDEKVIMEGNKYYINIDDIDDITPYIEFGNIIYQNKID